MKSEMDGRIILEEIISVNRLTKTFALSHKQMRLEKTKQRHKTALNNLSFKVYQGEIFGLLGSNGAGKTTTLRILATLLTADSGTIKINGIDVRENPEKLRREIGFLTSDLKLEEYFTPNYLYDFFSNLYGVDRVTTAQRKNKLFCKFGIDKFAEVKIANLSTGMKQKVSLVIAMVHNPEVLIFDEPTNGLDVLTAKIVTDFLLDLQAMGKTILVSTHIFSLIEKICDRVGIMIDGHMAECFSLNSQLGTESVEDRFFRLYRELEGDNFAD